MSTALMKYKEVAAANLQPSDLGHVFSVEEEGNKLVSTLQAFGIIERPLVNTLTDEAGFTRQVTLRGVDSGFNCNIDTTVTIYVETKEAK